MSMLQRLYDLDSTFSDQLDELLHDQEYVTGLRALPDRELVKLVDHLSDVGFTPATGVQLIAFADPDST